MSFYDGAARLDFIRSHYDKEMVQTYLSINPRYGPARADLSGICFSITMAASTSILSHLRHSAWTMPYKAPTNIYSHIGITNPAKSSKNGVYTLRRPTQENSSSGTSLPPLSTLFLSVSSGASR